MYRFICDLWCHFRSGFSIKIDGNISKLYRDVFFLVGIGILCLNFYVIISVLNYNSILKYSFFNGSKEATGVDIQYFDCISWLPHTYDRNMTLRASAKYLALSLIFSPLDGG